MRKYDSDASRQRAYRNRLRDKQHEALRNPNGWVSGEPITTEDQLLDYLDSFRETDTKWECKECGTWNFLLYPSCRHCAAPIEDSVRGSSRDDFFAYFSEAQKFRDAVENRDREARSRLESLNG